MSSAAAEEPGPGPARLGWLGPAFLPPEVLQRLVGPGARHELVTEDVLGHQMQVFVNRAANLRALLDRAVAEQPDAPALVDGDRTWTFAEVAHAADALARLLTDAYGIGPGDRVGIVAANSPEYALAMWATVSIGAVIASLNGWWTGPELAYGIELSEPSILLGDERRLARLPSDAVPPGVPVLTLDAVAAEAAALEDPKPVEVDVDEDDPAVILFTSGTTGRPKGATLSHRNIVNFGEVVLLSAEVGKAMAPAPDPSAPPRPAPRPPASILASPMFHVSGMLGVLMSGPVLRTKLVFPPPGRWDETTHLEITQQHGITTWSGVPTQWWRLLRHPDLATYDLSSLVSIGGGGAPFPPELTRALQEHLPHVTLGNGYGMSETVGLGTIIGGPAMVAMPDSVGPAQPGVELEIRGPDGELLREGEVGEIHLRSPSVFLGYWRNPEATADALDADRWYRTGDFGRVQGGMLYLESRARDLIIRGGENIYPLEIEHRLVEHPDIDDAAVIGVDHLELGQEVKAFVVPRAGSSLTPADVQRWAADALASFKVPAHVELRDALPYTDTGKVLKHVLEQEERDRSA